MKLGRVVMTRTIAEEIDRNAKFASEINTCIRRYLSYDWGELDEEDKKANDDAVLNNERVLASYHTVCDKVWIITEWDRSYTTILFPDEY